MNALAQNLYIEPIEDDPVPPADTIDTLLAEIADFEVERVEDRGENNAVSRWFMRKSLPEKAKIASAFSLGSLLIVAGLAMTGFAIPELAGPIQIAIVAVTVVGAMLGFASLHFILERIIVPFNAVAHGMTRLSQGEREVSVYGTGRSDEIGAMARALEVFVKSRLKLDQLLALQKSTAEQRERERAAQTALADTARREAIDRLAADFENSIGRVVGRVASASAQLQETATSMAIAAEQAAIQTGQVASAMDQTQTGVTSAATASDEFAMSIDEISRQATHSAELARKANATAESADATISALSDSAAQVGQIVELIQSIAQKTNLLALNASIEAARGGEAGRGFAVVASEVKELASQTSRATQDVADQIRAIQGSTGNSVTALRTIADQIVQLEATAVSIASAVDQQAIAGRDLARNIDIAARATDDVSASIDQVSETSVMTGAAASQVLSSATELEEQASSLRKDVDRFLRQVRAG